MKRLRPHRKNKEIDDIFNCTSLTLLGILSAVSTIKGIMVGDILLITIGGLLALTGTYTCHVLREENKRNEE